MSLPFKYKGQEKRIPTSWDDLTVGQCIDLIEWSKTGENDMIKLASIASGIEVGELKEMKVEKVTDVAFPLYQLVIHDSFDKDDWTCPPSFQILDRRYSSYQEIGNLKYGCMDIFEKTIADESTTLIEKIPLIIASVVYEGKFAGRELEARKDIETLANEGVMNMPIKFAYPIATFFLSKYESSLAAAAQKAMDTPTSKSKPESRTWRSLVNSVRSILFRAATRSSSVKS